MGRCTCPPVVKLNPDAAVTPKLLWFPVNRMCRGAGEMLLAAELLLKDKVKKIQNWHQRIHLVQFWCKQYCLVYPTGE